MNEYITISVTILENIASYLILEPYIYIVGFFLVIAIVTILKRSIL